MRNVGLGVMALSLLAGGCMRPAEERALKDLTVGLAEVGGVAFTVEDGLAVVRKQEPGVLTLWGSAPAFHVRAVASAGAAENWTVVVRNAMQEAELSVQVGNDVLPVESLPGPLPTEKRWRVRLPAGAEARLTVAPPTWNQAVPFRFAALADVQEALPRVGDIYRRINEDPSLRFIFFSGDLTRRGSVAELEEFQSRLQESRIPLFATLGNHELYTPDDMRWHEYFGRGNLHFTFQGVHFTLIDSGNGTLDPKAEEMLDGWLAAGQDAVHILGTHIPIVDPVGVRNGAFGSRNEAASLLAKLARGRMDLTLYGHVHSYYSFSNAGIPSFISGGGGAIPEQFDGVGRHFLAVEVDPARGVRNVSLVRVD